MLKDTSFVQTRLARDRAEEQRKEEVAARVREERELRESRKKEREKKRKEEIGRKVSSDSESDNDTMDAREKKSFSIPRYRASSPLSEKTNKHSLSSSPGSR